MLHLTLSKELRAVGTMNKTEPSLAGARFYFWVMDLDSNKACFVFEFERERAEAGADLTRLEKRRQIAELPFNASEQDNLIPN